MGGWILGSGRAPCPGMMATRTGQVWLLKVGHGEKQLCCGTAWGNIACVRLESSRLFSLSLCFFFFNWVGRGTGKGKEKGRARRGAAHGLWIPAS